MKNISQEDWNYERARLEKTVKLIEDKLENLKNKEDVIAKDMRALREDFWSNQPTVVESSYDLKTITGITQNMQNIHLTAQREATLKKNSISLNKLRQSPYFARIDFDEEGEGLEEYYIGIATLMDDDFNIHVYDWRAPVCSMFYQNKMGQSSYKCLEGEIKGDLTFKRQYKIEEQELKFMFNSTVKVDDEFLQKILSDTSDDKMKSIIQSIQEEQDKAIRFDNSDLVIIQGPAGSGKTSVALHRAAYLLYTNKDRGIMAHNIVIFSPNDIFNDYISDVLPKLGEENVYQTTFLQYVNDSLGDRMKIEDPNDQMEYILNGDGSEYYKTRMENIAFKNTLTFSEIIDKHIRYLETRGTQFKDLSFRGNLIMTKEEQEDLFYNTYSKWPINYRFMEMRKDVFERLGRNKKEMIKDEIEKESGFDKEYESDEFLRNKIYNEYNEFKDRIKKYYSVNHLREYKNILRNKSLFYGKEFKGRVPSNIKRILSQTFDSLNRRFISYEDAVALVYIRHRLGKGVKDLSAIKFVIIDEAQDYTPFQYKIFKELFPKANFTILGDINQSINPLNTDGIYESISEQFHYKKPVKKELLKSYRSTEEIFNFAKSAIKSDQLVNVCRNGKKPQVKTVNSEEDRVKGIAKDTQAMLEDGMKTIGIVCRTMEEAEKLHSSLSKILDFEINLLTKNIEKFQGGVSVVPSYLAKGLEFDGVFVANAEDKVYNADNERKLFYTVCTRALHELILYSKGEITRYIDGESQEFCDII